MKMNEPIYPNIWNCALQAKHEEYMPPFSHIVRTLIPILHRDDNHIWGWNFPNASF